MKKNMTKCVIGLLLVCVLFLACDSDLPNSDLPKRTETEEETKMIIKNQSSIIIDSVRYCGSSIYGATYNSILYPCFENSKSFYSYQMSDGDKIGYIYFNLLTDKSKYGLKSMFAVKTNEVVSLKKGCTTTFIITDNTLVVPEGKQQSFTILDLMTPRVLEIVNNSSIDFYSTEYMGVLYATHRSKLASGGRFTNKFYTFDDDGDYIYFIVFDSKIQDKRVRIAGERIKLEKGKKRTISIDESTLVYVLSESTEKTLGEVIK